ncbi:MAG: cyclic pyranopterin monophosphate synthase MoaC [Polyangiaceae bacterium]
MKTKASSRTKAKLTHTDAHGRANMVDVAPKPETARSATARAVVHMAASTVALVRASAAKKGDVLAVARVAGIQGAKRTSDLVPLCHPIRLTRVRVDFELGHDSVVVIAEADAFDRTGVEMEAMVAASTAALTVYDMVKAVDRGVRIELALTSKSGGRSGTWTRDVPPTASARPRKRG